MLVVVPNSLRFRKRADSSSFEETAGFLVAAVLQALVILYRVEHLFQE